MWSTPCKDRHKGYLLSERGLAFMREYIIMTDSCCDFSAELVEELGIQVLPLSFILQGREFLNYPDGRDMQPDEFYSRLRRGALGSTNPVREQAFLKEMTAIVESGRDVLCIAFSSALSATYQAAAAAARKVVDGHPGSTVAVVDSRAASLGQGLLVYLAVQQKNKGCSLEEVRAFAETARDHICHWFTVDDLNHLKRGGRLSAAAAFFGTMIKMKPVLHVDNEGRLVPVSTARGREASIQALLDKMAELVEDPSAVFISHADCEAEAVALGEAIKAKYPVENMAINYVGPVIGNHSGLGTLALFFVGRHK